MRADISNVTHDERETKWKMDVLEKKVEITADDEMLNDGRIDGLADEQKKQKKDHNQFDWEISDAPIHVH